MFVPKKSILVSKAPNQFPNCWFHDPDDSENIDRPIPQYDTDVTKIQMNFTTKLCDTHKNLNSEEDEWETKILKYGWSQRHLKLFSQVVKVLDYDRLARLTNVDNKRYEAVQQRAIIDKSAERMRKALASVAWDTPLVQWIHGLLMEFLPPSYLAAYLDIMQVLKQKLPSLVDKMIFWKPGNVNQDLLAPILKKPWQPALVNTYRKLPGQVLLIVIPSAAPRLSPQSSRIQKLYQLITTLAPMLPIQIPVNSSTAQKQSLQSIAEQIVSVTRTKIQDLKQENPDRRLILIGMNSGAAVAMQVALVEQVSGVVCFGFSYNTVHGVRGQPDDHFLDLSSPVMFLVGQNAARSSEEELEHFREKITAPTTIVTVGSADDFLRVSKTKRRLEGVTQEMVDNIIVDEIADFSTKCLQRPLPPKTKAQLAAIVPRREIDSSTGLMRKRKSSTEGPKTMPTKAQKMMRPTSTSDEMLEMAVQSILPEEKLPSKPAAQKFVSVNRSMSVAQHQQQRTQLLHQITKVKPNQAQTHRKFVEISEMRKQMQNRVQTSRPSTPTNQQTVRKVNFNKQQQQQQSFSPVKYTIVKSTRGPHNVAYVSESTSGSSSTDLTGANIFDMPIVFADNEGNIDEDITTVSEGTVVGDSPPNVSNKVVLKTVPSFTITKNKNILIQKPAPGKMFMINGTVIGKQLPAANIVLPKQTTTTTLPQQIKVQKILSGTKIFTSQMKPMTATGSKKIEILNNTIIKPASTSGTTNLTRIQSGSFVNLADAKPMTTIGGGRLSLPIATTSTSTTKNQIIIKTNTLKPYTGTQILPTSFGANKQLGTLTVKRVNLAPGQALPKYGSNNNNSNNAN